MTTPDEGGALPAGAREAYLAATAAANQMLQNADQRTAAAVHAQLATAHAVMYAADILAELRAELERSVDARK